MGFRALLRGTSSSAVRKELELNLATDNVPSLSEGSVFRTARARITALRGAWSKNAANNSMTSSTSSSSYPITMMDGLTKNVELDLKDIGQGMGAALWVTDANNWWGVGISQDAVTCGCTTCSSYSCQTCSSYSCGSCPRFGCTDRAPNGYCRAYGTWFYECNCGTSFFSCNCSTSYYTCGCTTCYPQYIRILQSVSGTVTALMTWTFSTVIRALKVKTLNKQISVDSYSDAAQSNLVANVSYNASSATETTNFGIMASPSSYNESKTLNSIKIRRNR